jgi:hypothetical protein
METPIEEILKEEQQNGPNQGGFDQQPPVVQQMQMPVQDLPAPSKLSILKEHMGQKQEYVSVVFVFVVLFLATSGILSYPVKGSQLLWTDNKLTTFGAAVVSIIGALLYFVLRLLTKLGAGV